MQRIRAKTPRAEEIAQAVQKRVRSRTKNGVGDGEIQDMADRPSYRDWVWAPAQCQEITRPQRLIRTHAMASFRNEEGDYAAPIW